LTYARDGLACVLDMGTWWREETGLPLPLGGNAIRRDLGAPVHRMMNQALRDSVNYALHHREEALAHAMQYARDLDTPSANRFVGMYVNERTLDYGEDGKTAIRRLLEMGHERGVIPQAVHVDFAE
jgi:1,4-dihydroxy-6-naphthoate synthase